MRKHCGNCANHRKEKNHFSEECGKCVSARLENGEMTDPSHWKAKPHTNADRIRAMSDEELSDFIDAPTLCKGHELGDCLSKDCKKCISEWLKQPAEEEAQQDCTYNKNGHCIGQKMMPECDPKNCDRRK